MTIKDEYIWYGDKLGAIYQCLFWIMFTYWNDDLWTIGKLVVNASRQKMYIMIGYVHLSNTLVAFFMSVASKLVILQKFIHLVSHSIGQSYDDSFIVASFMFEIIFSLSKTTSKTFDYTSST